jgi:DNA-binding response OmpR family regulator
MMSLPADFPRKPSVLCVEDDLNLQKSISFILWKEGYEVTCAQTGEEAVEIARREKPDLVLLDLVLPGIDGLKVSAILRKDPATADILIIMVSAKRGVDDVVRGLKSYADDYITKPFDPRVLLARVQSVLRRRGGTEAVEKTTLEIDGLVINRGSYEVFAGGRKIGLTRTEFEILALLAGKPNQVFTRSKILDNVREDGYPITERVVDYHVTGLRKKLGRSGRYVRTVRGVGYKFNAEENS